MSQSERVGLVADAVAFVILIARAVFGALSIGRPLSRIGAVLLELAHGNRAVEIPYVARGDEVGDAARAANTFRDNLVEMERLQAEERAAEKHQAQEQAVAAKEKASAERKEMMARLAAEFEAAVGNIVETVSNAFSDLKAAAVSQSKTAETTEQLSATAASASEDGSDNVESVAAASEEMTGSVQEIGRQVHESNRIAEEAVARAEKTDARIGQLSEAAARIGDVAVNNVSDTKGNYFTVAYINDTVNGQAYPSRIDYTGYDSASLVPYNWVRFVYDTSRPDVVPIYHAGSLIKTTVRLTNVQAYAGTQLVADYRLAYQQGSATGRSQLASAALCDGTNTCLPATTFTWQNGTLTPAVITNVAGQNGTLSDSSVPFVGDFNGDGIADIMWMATLTTRVLWTSTGNGNFSVISNFAGQSSSLMAMGCIAL